MYLQRFGNKYHSVRSEYGGYFYQSKLEAAYAQELDLRLKAKQIKGWRRQPRFALEVNGRLIKHYKPDFEITHRDGSRELVECKGMWTEEARLTVKLFEATYLYEHPEVTFTVIKKGVDR